MIIHSSHKTRTSDASTFDEICINCGGTDRIGDTLLSTPCTKSKFSDSKEGGYPTAKKYILNCNKCGKRINLFVMKALEQAVTIECDICEK